MRSDKEKILASGHRFVRLMLDSNPNSAELLVAAFQEIPETPGSIAYDKQFRIRLFAEVFKRLSNNEDQGATVGSESDDAAQHDKREATNNDAGAITRHFYQLPFHERAATALVVVEQFTITEAAKIMSSDKDTVRAYLNRARRKLNPDIIGRLGAAF